MKKLVTQWPCSKFIVLSLAYFFGLQASAGDDGLNLVGASREGFSHILQASDRLQQFEFDPIIAVNSNRGAFTTEINIPLPPNLVGLQSLRFRYDSQNTYQSGLGMGWYLDLPFIQRNRSSNASAPFIAFGSVGHGVLTRSAESIKALSARIEKLLAQAVGVQGPNSALQITPYRFQIDAEKYTLFLQANNSSEGTLAWLALQPNGMAWVFSKDGLPVLLADVRQNSLSFEWRDGLLQKINHSNLGWSLNVLYRNEFQKLPVATAQGVFAMPLGIQQITIAHRDAAKPRTYRFYYDHEYLNQVVQDDAVLPLFQGHYDAMAATEAPTLNALHQQDDSVPVFFQKLDTLEVLPEQNGTIYVDLNGDGRTDRIRINSQELFEKIKQPNKRSEHSEYILDDINRYVQGIQDQHVMTVELAQWDPSTNQVFFKEDPSLVIRGGRFKPQSISYHRKLEKDEAGTQVYSYSVDRSGIINHGTYFIDLYGTGRKTLVYCPGQNELDLRQTFTHDGSHSLSNLHLSILSLIDPTQIDSLTYTNTLSGEGNLPIVLEQGVNEQALQSLLAEHKANPSKNLLTNPVLGASQWVERKENFRCNQYSLFFDANGDGVVDVLTGKTLFLRQVGLSSENIYEKKLTDDEYRAFFAKPEVLDRNHSKYTLVWLPSERRFVLKSGFVNVNLLNGTLHFDKFGSGVAVTPAPHQKLLTKVISPFGGDIRVQYEFRNGVWVVDRTVRDPKGKQPISESRFAYDTPNRDPYSGFFLGFHLTRETQQVGDQKGRIEPREILRTFLKDALPEVVNYQTRARIQGHLVEEIVKAPNTERYYRSRFLDWSISPLFHGATPDFSNRWVLFPALEEEKIYGEARDLLADKRSLLRFQEWYSDPNAGALLPIKTLRRIEDGLGLSSIFTDRMMPEVGNFFQILEMYPAIYRTSLKEKYSTGKDNASFRDPIKIVNNSFGESESACQGEVCFQYSRDTLGRVTRQQNNLGSWTELTYAGASPIVHTLADQDTATRNFSGSADPYRGHYVEIMSPEGRRQTIEYSADGLVLRTQSQDSTQQAGLAERFRLIPPALANVDGYIRLQGPASTWVDGKRELVEFDGFGRPFRKQTETPEGPLFSGESVYGGFGGKSMLLETSLASFANFVPVGEPENRASQKKWDALDRIRLDWSVQQGTWQYGYPEHCTVKKLNGALRAEECVNIMGHPTSSNYFGDSTEYTTNFLGDITETTWAKEWRYNRRGDVVRSYSTVNEQPGDRSMWASTAEFDVLNRTRIEDERLLQRFDSEGRILETARIQYPQPTDIFEKRTYQMGRLAQNDYFDASGAIVPALTHRFSYNAAGLPELEKAGPVQITRAFDFADRLLRETVQVGSNSTESINYEYRSGQLVALPKWITSIKRNEEGLVTSITYAGSDVASVAGLPPPVGGQPKSPLVLTRTYDRRSARPAGITMGRNGTPDYSESYQYAFQTRLMENRTVSTSFTVPQGSSQSEAFAHRGPRNNQPGVFLDDAPTLVDSRAIHRDTAGRLLDLGTSTGKVPITWNDQNLAGFKGYTFYYNAEGSLVSACPAGKPLSDSACLVRLSGDLFLLEGQMLDLIRVDGLPVGVRIENVFYPVVADAVGSIKAMWSSDGSEMLWTREYTPWGVKTIQLNPKQQALAEKLERLCLWSFAGLVEIPGIGSDLYWSASRVYAPSVKEWASPDPMIQWSPKLAAKKPGNWASTRYANNSPLMLVDPSGQFWHIAAGGLIGGGAAGLGAYAAGHRGADLAKAVAIGAIGGAASATGFGGIAGAAVMGFGTSVAHQAIVEKKTVSSLRVGEAMFSAAISASTFRVGSYAAKHLEIPGLDFTSRLSPTAGSNLMSSIDEILRLDAAERALVGTIASGTTSASVDMISSLTDRCTQNSAAQESESFRDQNRASNDGPSAGDGGSDGGAEENESEE